MRRLDALLFHCVATVFTLAILRPTSNKKEKRVEPRY